MPHVRDIIHRKGEGVWTIGPNASVYEALQEMADRGIGALVVTGDGGVLGILSERDYARKIILHNRTSRNTTVGEIMTSPAVTVTMDDDVKACMKLMTENRFRHLPVLQQGRLVAVVSIGDVVKSIMENQRYQIEQLSQYMQMGAGS